MNELDGPMVKALISIEPTFELAFEPCQSHVFSLKWVGSMGL